MNISITGNLGAGKSSVCRELKKMGFEIVSVGKIFRQIAQERNISVRDFNEMVNTMHEQGDDSIDFEIDQKTARLNLEIDNAVFDSRLAWFFAEGSFKVFLKLDIDEAAKRVYYGNSRQAESYISIEEAKRSLIERSNFETERYIEIYNLDYMNMSNFDLIIDSANLTPKEIAENIVCELKKHESI